MKRLLIDSEFPDGAPRELGRVAVTLIGGTAGAVIGNRVVADPVVLPLDDEGHAEIDLATNDVEVTSPATSFYRVTVLDSSPTITRSIRLTDDLAAEVSWTDPAIAVADRPAPDASISAAYVTTAPPHGVFDPATIHAAIVEAVVQLFPDESEEISAVAEIVATQIEEQVDLVTLTDPARLPNLLANAAEIAAHTTAGVGLLGLNVAALSASVAELVTVGPNPPAEPSNPSAAVWIRTPGDLRAFVDFRSFPDGPIDGVTANGVGSIFPAPVLGSFTEVYPPFGGVPAVVTDGVVRSSGVAVDGDDPTPRTGFTFVGVGPGESFRIEWGFGGYTETDGTFTTYSPTNVAISAPYTDLPPGAAGPDAYLAGFVVGRFVGDTDDTDPGQPERMRVKLIRDDLGAPTTIASAALPRMPIRGVDRIAFTGNLAGEFAVHFNGEEITTAVDTIHDVSTFTGIGMVMHQGSDGDHTWEDAWYCGVEWFGISGGDHITGDLGPHRWTEEAGWVPLGPAARPALNAGSGGGLDEPAVQALVDAAVANLVDGAPGALDTLNELAAALADDASFAAAMTTALAGKVGTSDSRLTDTRTPTDASVTVAKLAAAVAGRLPATARAASSDTRSTTGSGAIDAELKFAGAATTFYRVDMHVQLSGDPTIDGKVGIAAPAGSTCSVIVDYYATNIAASTGAEQRGHITDIDATGAINVGVIASPGLAVSIIGWVQTGGTAGDIGLWWRPANTGAVTRHAGSYIDHSAP